MVGHQAHTCAGIRSFAIGALFLSLVIPLSAFAHPFGVSYEAVVDGYAIDIGYSSAAPAEGESIIFDFNFPSGGADIAYSDVWVRINGEKGNVVFASGIHNAAFGGPRMSYVFPEAGAYTISARYENNSEKILEVAFPLTVVPKGGTAMRFDTNLILGGVFGMFVSAFLMFGYRRFLEKKKP